MYMEYVVYCCLMYIDVFDKRFVSLSPLHKRSKMWKQQHWFKIFNQFFDDTDPIIAHQTKFNFDNNPQFQSVS